MAKKHDIEPGKTWVHLNPNDAHVFDQTNGYLKPEDTLERPEGLSDEERSAAAAIIGNGFSARM